MLCLKQWDIIIIVIVIILGASNLWKHPVMQSGHVGCHLGGQEWYLAHVNEYTWNSDKES